MKYRHIVSVTGLSGLYQLMSTKTAGAIIKSLEDGSNKFISSRKHQVTPLESIELYTEADNIHLHEVLEKLKTQDEAIHKLDFKNNNEFIAVFNAAVPEYDKDRVYHSDIKKILKWYILLKKNDLLDFSEYFKKPDEENNQESIDVETADLSTDTKDEKLAKEKSEKDTKTDTDKAASKKTKTATKKSTPKKDTDKMKPVDDKVTEKPVKIKATEAKKKSSK